MPIVKQEIIVRSVHAHLTSSEMAIPDVTQNVPNTMTAHETRYFQQYNWNNYLHNIFVLPFDYLECFSMFFIMNWRLVSNSNVETHAENLIQTFVAKVQTVK